MNLSDISATGDNQEPRLEVLLIRVRDLHCAAQQAGCNALHHAMDAGDALIQIQKQITGCPWKGWLAANCSVPVRTAMLYMQLAKHRSEIESNLEELSIRGALRLITKPRNKAAEKPPCLEESLQSLWAKASDHDKTEFCDAVGVSGFRRIWSLNFHRTLLDSVRIEKFEAQPNGKLTIALWTALSLLGSIDDPGSSEIVRKANTNALLTALRTLKSAVRAAGNTKGVALSLVDIGTIDKIRASYRKKSAA